MDNTFEQFISTAKHYDLNKLFNGNLSMPEYVILRRAEYICTQENKNCVWVSELVDGSPVTPQAISKCLRKMEQNGYIERFTNVDDRRVTGVRVTESGKEIYYYAVKKIDTMMEIIRNGFEDGEYDELIKLVKKFESLYIQTIKEILSKQDETEDNK